MADGLVVRALYRVSDRLGFTDPFDRPTDKELAAWAETRTLDDLGALTVRWLRGDLRLLPRYCSSVDVDENHAPGITDALVALNEAGLPTTNSQGGFEGILYPEETWGKAPAWVDVFADGAGLAWLTGVLAGTPFVMASHRAGSGWESLADLADDWTGYGLCHPDLVTAVCSAWQVRISDPVPGLNDLWPVLYEAAKARS